MQKLKSPTFSIIVPCYNVEKYIVECMTSILGQSYSDFEVLCVEDCGNDATLDILEVFEKNDKRVKVIKHKKNKGLGAARNTALKKAKGKYLICVDSDDYLASDCLECVLKAFALGDYKAIWFKANKYDHEKQIMGVYNHYPIFTQTPEGELFLDQDNLLDYPLVTWNKAYDREFVLSNDIYWTVGKMFEDVEFYWKFHTNVDKVYVIDKPLYIYRKRAGSICTRQNDFINKVSDLYAVTTNVYHYLKEKNLFQKYKKQYMKYVLDTLREIYAFNSLPIEYAKLNLKYLKDINFPEDYKDCIL